MIRDDPWQKKNEMNHAYPKTSWMTHWFREPVSSSHARLSAHRFADQQPVNYGPTHNWSSSFGLGPRVQGAHAWLRHMLQQTDDSLSQGFRAFYASLWVIKCQRNTSVLEPETYFLYFSSRCFLRCSRPRAHTIHTNKPSPKSVTDLKTG